MRTWNIALMALSITVGSGCGRPVAPTGPPRLGITAWELTKSCADMEPEEYLAKFSGRMIVVGTVIDGAGLVTLEGGMALVECHESHMPLARGQVVAVLATGDGARIGEYGERYPILRHCEVVEVGNDEDTVWQAALAKYRRSDESGAYSD